MDFQWILLAAFAVALVWGIAQAITRPMLKNVLRLICVPVAFIITFILQIAGVFQLLITKISEFLELASLLPGLEKAVEFSVAYVSTILSPLLFISVFFVLLFVFRTVHVNLIVKFLEGRSRRLAKRDLKARIKVEKENAIQIAEESEERIAELNAKNNFSGSESSEYYKLPDEDELEDMAEERVKREFKNRKRSGFFKESGEQKAISVVCGAVSGFLIFAIVMMPIFYTMSVFSAVTDGIKSTDTEESVVYQVVSVADKHFVQPYEKSFVIQLYESMALVDLMNYTVRAGGKIVLDSGEVMYADDKVKSLISNTVGAAVEMTAADPDEERLAENLGVITSDQILVSVLTNVVKILMNNVQTPSVEEGDIFSEMSASLVTHYKNVDEEIIANDLAAISDLVVVLTEKGIFASVLSGENVDMGAMLKNKEDLSDILGSMVGLSAFDPVVGGTFELGVQMLGTMLGAPADDAAAYDALIEDILEKAQEADSSTFDTEAVKAFVEGCAAQQDNKVSSYAAEDPEGFDVFLAYMSQWSNIQSAFMNSSEDRSLAYFTMNVNGTLYIFNMGEINKIEDLGDMKDATITAVSDPDAEEYSDKISPIAELIHYLTVNCSAIADEASLKDVLLAYTEEGEGEYSSSVAAKLMDRDAFVSSGVTVQKMVDSLEFEDWTLEEKEKDVDICVEIIFNLLGIMDDLGSSAAAENTVDAEDTADAAIDAMLGQFVNLGTTMDLMMETSCMRELPPLMMDALIKNDLFSNIMTPSIVNQINDKVQNNPDLSYTEYMESLVGVFKIALKALEK